MGVDEATLLGESDEKMMDALSDANERLRDEAREQRGADVPMLKHELDWD